MTLYSLQDGTGSEVARTPSIVVATLWADDTGTALVPIFARTLDGDRYVR